MPESKELYLEELENILSYVDDFIGNIVEKPKETINTKLEKTKTLEEIESKEDKIKEDLSKRVAKNKDIKAMIPMFTDLMTDMLSEFGPIDKPKIRQG